MDLGRENIDNSVKGENVELVMEKLGLYSEDSAEKVEIPKDYLNGVPGVSEDLSNAVLYLREQGALETKKSGSALILSPSGGFEPDGDYNMGQNPYFTGKKEINDEEIKEVCSVIGGFLEEDQGTFSVSEVKDELDDSREVYPELNILSGTGYMEVSITKEGELIYKAEPEKADELRDINEDLEKGYITESSSLKQEEWHKNNPWKPPI